MTDFPHHTFPTRICTTCPSGSYEAQKYEEIDRQYWAVCVWNLPPYALNRSITYKIKLGRLVTPNLLPAMAPVLPLFTLATLIRPLCLQATVSRRASSWWHAMQSSRKKCTNQSPVVAPEDAWVKSMNIVEKPTRHYLLVKAVPSLF